jgi:phosphoribosylaminoimidazole carboxylase PurE protein
MPSGKIVVILGSKSDLDFAKPLFKMLEDFGVSFERRIASAHKTPEKLLEILKEYEARPDVDLYITIAGRSNALSGMVDANVRHPVIACPLCSEKFGEVDIYSSLRLPSGVAPLVILDPEAAALAAVKILSLRDLELCEKVEKYQTMVKTKTEKADRELRRK